MSEPTDNVDRLDQAADEVDEELSVLLLEAADTIRMLRGLLDANDEAWLEAVMPEGTA